MSELDLNTIAGGQLAYAFQKSFEKVMENLLDPNCSAKDKRKIRIDLTFSENEQRNQFELKISTKETLAARFPAKTLVYMGKDLSNGQIIHEEAGSGLQGQMTINDYIQPEETAEPASDTNIVRYQKEA